MTASNSYGGLTTVSAGVLNLQNPFALGTTNSGMTVSSGAVLQLQGGFDVLVDWQTLGSMTADSLGQFDYTDTTPGQLTGV